MDIQFVSNAHGAAAYIAAYVSKGETEGLRRAAAEGLARMPPDSSRQQLLRRIGTTHLASRETSMQVCALPMHLFERGGGCKGCMWNFVVCDSAGSM